MTVAGVSSDSARRRLVLGLAVAAVVVALDQVSKWWIVATVMQPPRVIPVTSFFNLVMAWNRGVSFSLLWHESDYMPYALSAVALAIVVFLLRWLRQAERTSVALSLGLIIGGAVGNVIDRLRFGAVADFLDFHWAGWHFAAFNVADSAISVGVALIVIDGLFGRGEKA